METIEQFLRGFMAHKKKESKHKEEKHVKEMPHMKVKAKAAPKKHKK